jgi:diguanylate cyclase (GGDEF)-like protein/PAS domain S-box-containing protein
MTSGTFLNLLAPAGERLPEPAERLLVVKSRLQHLPVADAALGRGCLEDGAVQALPGDLQPAESGNPRSAKGLQPSELLCRSVLEASIDCIKVVDLDGRLQFMNARGCGMMELDAPSRLIGKRWEDLWPAQSATQVRDAIASAKAGGTARFSGYCPTARGAPRWWDVLVSPVRNDAGDVVRILAISRDITSQRQACRQFEWASLHDPLTKLPNRGSFEAHLQAATLRAMSSGGTVALLLIDLDHFKHVNDTMGHAAGDHLLAVISERLKQHLRAADFVARIGGDEFAVIIEGQADDVAERIGGAALCELLKQPFSYAHRAISVGCSIGGAMFPKDAECASELFKNADIALYALKNGGRGGTRMFHGHMREEAQRVASQLSLARTAVSGDTVEPHYQQKVDLRSGRIMGLEALLRWRHAHRGLQPPHTVAEAFKDYELAVKIGDLMQRKVFADLRQWLSRNLSVGLVAINAAPAEFLRDDFAECTIARLQEFGIPPQMIEIEVTEHVFLERGSEHVARALNRLNEAGIRIALDDFGTGYSSLSHLRDFPVNVVKIDRSFIERMAADPEVAAIVSAVIDLAKSLRMDVVAEGVESELQKVLLREMGCPLGQGYLFGRPVHSALVPRLVDGSCHKRVA